jgi:hypothetical protein
LPRKATMTTKVCTNIQCPAYAHFVYTVAMRCIFCRWDLKNAQRSTDLPPGARESVARASR